jgi:dipeptidyl aminopeptidase/acylaminoacyl peptidase
MTHRCNAATAAAAILLAAAAHGGTAAVPEIDVHAFARAPAFALPALSADGAFLSYVEQSGGRQTVVLRTLSDGTQRRTLDVESKRERVRWCDWAGAAYLLCGTIAPVRAADRVAETTHLYAIDAAGSRVRELNAKSPDPARDQVVDLLASRPGRVLLQRDAAGRGYPEVVELDVGSGEMSVAVRARPPVRRWMSDGRGVVRLGLGYSDGAASLWVRRPGAEDWTAFLEQSLADVEAVGPIALGATPSQLYVLKHHDGRAALFRLDLDRASLPELLFADGIYDVTGPVVLHPQTRALLAVRYVAEQERMHFFDAAEAAQLAWIDEQLPGAVNLVIDRSSDGSRLLVRSASDVEPPSLYVFDVEPRALALIGHDYPELEGRPLAPMQPMTYRARDGQVIPAYLTLPPTGGAAGLPAIVLPHGGPETRTMRAFDPLAQFLAANGYAVLQMNFRGSLGYGARFAAAGVGQWGGIIHNDITDAARWLVERRIADPTRMCIVGMSFGGYAALLGAVRESEWYACAASYAGVSDLMAFAQYTERLQDAQIWQERLSADQRALWQMSPMSRVRAIEAPVLMVHGRNDPVVPVSQARRFARYLRQSGKPHQFIERADCDHEMTIESCRIAFFAELQRFLTQAGAGL